MTLDVLDQIGQCWMHGSRFDQQCCFVQCDDRRQEAKDNLIFLKCVDITLNYIKRRGETQKFRICARCPHKARGLLRLFIYDRLKAKLFERQPGHTLTFMTLIHEKTPSVPYSRDNFAVRGVCPARSYGTATDPFHCFFGSSKRTSRVWSIVGLLLFTWSVSLVYCAVWRG